MERRRGGRPGRPGRRGGARHRATRARRPPRSWRPSPRLGGRAQWSPNEKVALEVALGAAFAGARALVTMKHVGLNVAADPLFTAAYTGVDGALVVVSADDPGMASSQNEQDNRRYAVAAGVPMLEPSDSQEAYDFTLAAFEISERWKHPGPAAHDHAGLPLQDGGAPAREPAAPRAAARFERDIRGRVMIPAYARPGPPPAAPEARRDPGLERDLAAQRRPRRGASRSASSPPASPSSTCARRRPRPACFKLGHDLPAARSRRCARSPPAWSAAWSSRRAIRSSSRPCAAAGIRGGGQGGDVPLRRAGRRPRAAHPGRRRVARAAPPRGPSRPQLCEACPYRPVFEHAAQRMDCIVAGDIGCYTLGVLQPFEAMDTCVCMGASIGRGAGAAPRAPRGAGAPGGERHRRLHLRPQRHHRAGGDGLQPACHRARADHPRQRHHRHDRPAGAPRHRPHPGARRHRARLHRGHGPGLPASRTSTWSTR